MTPISICIITKNEEKHIEHCLQAIRQSFDSCKTATLPHEIVVTDTGSTDRTKEIALQYADKVVDFAWIDDFAAARNYCISQASHDYILMLDSDEYILSADWEGIDRQIMVHPDYIGMITLQNEQLLNESQSHFTSQLERFFSKKLFHYESKVHEQIRPLPEYLRSRFPSATKEDGDQIALNEKHSISLLANHVGYVGDPEYLRKKSERDLALILKTLEENPANPYYLFQAGQCYNMLSNNEMALAFFEKALLFDLNPNLDYVKVLMTSYGYCLIHSGRTEEALALESVYEEFATSADFVILMGLIYTHNKLYMKALAEFVKALSFSDKETYMQGANKQIAHYNIGYIYEIFREKDMAITQYQMCGSYPMAIARLKELLPENPLCT